MLRANTICQGSGHSGAGKYAVLIGQKSEITEQAIVASLFPSHAATGFSNRAR